MDLKLAIVNCIKIYYMIFYTKPVAQIDLLCTVQGLSSYRLCGVCISGLSFKIPPLLMDLKKNYTLTTFYTLNISEHNQGSQQIFHMKFQAFSRLSRFSFGLIPGVFLRLSRTFLRVTRDEKCIHHVILCII